MKHTSKQPASAARGRAEQRDSRTARYGEPSDERGNRRFGHARTDDADPSEFASGVDREGDESPGVADPELAAAEDAGEIVGGGQLAGMHRADKPRKPARRGRLEPCASKSKENVACETLYEEVLGGLADRTSRRAAWVRSGR